VPFAGVGTLHDACAIAFFIVIVVVCWKYGRATKDLVADERKRETWNRRYMRVALLFVVPLALSLTRFVPWDFDTRVFWTEASGVWVFSLYWLLKTIEINESQADQKAAKRELRVCNPEGGALARLAKPPRVTGAEPA
jgi:hypothetical protein